MFSFFKNLTKEQTAKRIYGDRKFFSEKKWNLDFQRIICNDKFNCIFPRVLLWDDLKCYTPSERENF